MDKRIENLFNIRNPWQKKKDFLIPRNYINRGLEKELDKDLENDDILVIYGSRQTGKTTLLYKTIENLYSRGKNREDLFYFSADDNLFKKYFNEPSQLLDFILPRKKDKAYLFIDEAQKLTNPGIYLKNLYDFRIKDLKIIVTGSSLLEIKSQIIEHLPGRKKTYMLYPLSFKEILKYEKAIDDKRKKEIWEEYIIYGGYPKVFLSPSTKQKQRELYDIYESYVKKDISGYLNIEKPEKFNQLALYLADQITGLVNINELTNSLGLNRATLERYLSILEDTFVVKKIFPFFRNSRTETTKMPKIYFIDLGIRNMVMKQFAPSEERADGGKLAENFVFNQLDINRDANSTINFWRTKAGAEIDFVVSRSGRADDVDLYEVKYSKTIKFQETAAMRSFNKKYQSRSAHIIAGNKQSGQNYNILFWEM